MSISLACACGKRLRVPEHFAGRKMSCVGCGAVLVVPDGQDRANPLTALAVTQRLPRNDDHTEPSGPVAILPSRPQASGAARPATGQQRPATASERAAPAPAPAPASERPASVPERPATASQRPSGSVRPATGTLRPGSPRPGTGSVRQLAPTPRPGLASAPAMPPQEASPQPEGDVPAPRAPRTTRLARDTPPKPSTQRTTRSRQVDARRPEREEGGRWVTFVSSRLFLPFGIGLLALAALIGFLVRPSAPAAAPAPSGVPGQDGRVAPVAPLAPLAPPAPPPTQP